jgi:hypothetical protein
MNDPQVTEGTSTLPPAPTLLPHGVAREKVGPPPKSIDPYVQERLERLQEIASAEIPVVKTLFQRIAAITGEVDIEATGSTGQSRGNRAAISIGDVDKALKPLFAKHGVVSDYEFADKPEMFKMPTEKSEMLM